MSLRTLDVIIASMEKGWEAQVGKGNWNPLRIWGSSYQGVISSTTTQYYMNQPRVFAPRPEKAGYSGCFMITGHSRKDDTDSNNLKDLLQPHQGATIIRNLQTHPPSSQYAITKLQGQRLSISIVHRT